MVDLALYYIALRRKLATLLMFVAFKIIEKNGKMIEALIADNSKNAEHNL